MQCIQYYMVKCAHDILEQIYNENLTCFGKSTFNVLHDDSHIIILFSFGKKGLVLTFIKIKANLFLPLAYQKGIQNLQSQLYIIWLKSILVLLNHFIINDDLYKYKYICKGHALINILHLRVDQHIALRAEICICKFTRGRLFKETFTLLLWVIPYFYFSLWHIK